MRKGILGDILAGVAILLSFAASIYYLWFMAVVISEFRAGIISRPPGAFEMMLLLLLLLLWFLILRGIRDNRRMKRLVASLFLLFFCSIAFELF